VNRGRRRLRRCSIVVAAVATPLAVATPSAADELPRVGVFGDSVAFSLLFALASATTEPDFVRTGSDVKLGCGIAVSPMPPPDEPRSCDDPAGRYALAAAIGEVTVAIMISCQWELVPQPIPGSADDRTRVIGGDEFDAYVRAQYVQVADALTASGVERILWTRCPYMSQVTGVEGLSVFFRASRDPERMDRLNAIIDDVAAERDDIEVLALDAWVNRRVDDPSIRPDGSHYEWRVHNDAADAFITIVNDILARDRGGVDQEDASAASRSRACCTSIVSWATIASIPSNLRSLRRKWANRTSASSS
jgi:hypothetical protein